MSKDVRLLPAVIGVGAILFALKMTGVVFTATAATPPSAPATTAAPGAPPANDPTAAIHAAMPLAHGTQTAQADAPQPSLPPELEGAGVTSAEMDVLSSLADRRSALDDRERELQLRANLIAATEQRVNQKIAELKTLQTQIQQLLDQSATMEKAQVDALVKAYSGMKPADAARIFTQLDDAVRLAVASRMKPDAIAGILAKMPAAEAQKLTVELATRLKLPAPTAAAATVAAATPPPAPVPAPQTVASLTPPPAQPSGLPPAVVAPIAAPIAAPTAPTLTAPATPAATPPSAPAPAPQTQATVEPPHATTPAIAPVIAPIAAPAPAAHAPAARHPAAAPRPRHAPQQQGAASHAPAPLQSAQQQAPTPPAVEPAPAPPVATPTAPSVIAPTPTVPAPTPPAVPRANESHGPAATAGP